MPYADNADLPASVRLHLPAHAQTIFRAAFNHAMDTYGDEARAFRIAWAAVKHRYEKRGSLWVEKADA